MNISILKSSLPPTGIAEAVIAPVMKAITNAIFFCNSKTDSQASHQQAETALIFIGI